MHVCALVAARQRCRRPCMYAQWHVHVHTHVRVRMPQEANATALVLQGGTALRPALQQIVSVGQPRM